MLTSGTTWRQRQDAGRNRPVAGNEPGQRGGLPGCVPWTVCGGYWKCSPSKAYEAQYL